MWPLHSQSPLCGTLPINLRSTVSVCLIFSDDIIFIALAYCALVYRLFEFYILLFFEFYHNNYQLFRKLFFVRVLKMLI